MAQTALKVGNWTVAPDLNRLSAPGTTVKIEPKAMAVLVYLANRAGQVVARDALLVEVWPGVVVSDDSLTQVIIKLRKALGDDPDRPTYVQTITKRGYRLIAPVLHSAETGTLPTLPRPHRARWIAAAVTAALLMTMGLWWGFGQRAGWLSPDADFVAQLPTVTVAPLEALGSDKQELLLARGITADLQADLSKSPGILVIGFSPMEGRTAGDPAGRAGSRYLVSGTVQRVDDRLRLHVFLTEQGTGKQLWSERFDRSLTDLFAIQDELGPKIARVLPTKVTEAELRRMARRHTSSLQAYEQFQLGQAALLARQKSDNETARQLFRRAIDLDKTFARAYSGLALTYAADYRNQWTTDGSEALQHAFEMARTANEINPDIPETYWTLAYVHAQRREHQQALRYLEKSLSLYPSFADAYALMASIKTYAGQPADSVALMRKAMRLNPRSGYLYFLVLGRAYFFLGNLEQAQVNLEEALKRNPEYLETHIYLAMVDLAKRDRVSAEWEVEQVRALDPSFNAKRWLGSYPLIDGEQKARLTKALDEIGG